MCTFFNNQRVVHKSSVRRIEKYLKSTSTYVDLQDRNWQLTTRGVVFSPDIETNIDCYVNYDFAGWWDQSAADNAENFMSCMGYVITCAVCSVLWCTKSQTEIVLSTTEAEYFTLIQKMCKVIPFFRNMFRHTLMGRQSTRLETIELVNQVYVLV